MREPLRHRNFRLLFAAQCASFLGDAIFIVALAFAVLQVTGSAAALGTVLALGGATLVITLSVSGVWADRLPRVKLMVTSDLVRLVSQGTLSALLLTDTATLTYLITLNVVYNMATAFFQPARTGLMPQLLEAHHLVQANGLMGVVERVTLTVGWATGGILVGAIGPGWAIAIDSLTFAVSAAFLLAIANVPTLALAADRRPFFEELAEGWREVRSRRWIWFTIASATSFLLVYEGPLQVIGPVTMDDVYDGATTWGILLAGGGIGSAVGALLAASDRLRRPLIWSLWLFLACALLPLLLLLEAPMPVLFASNVVAGASFGLFIPVWEAALQRGVPPEKLARVSAWDWMGSLAGMPIGMALAGWLVDGVGRTAVLATMSIGTFVVCLAFLVEPAVRQIDQQHGGPGDAPDPSTA